MGIESATTEAIVGVQYSHATGDSVEANSQSKSFKKRKWHWGKNVLNASYDSASTNRSDYRH